MRDRMPTQLDRIRSRSSELQNPESRYSGLARALAPSPALSDSMLGHRFPDPGFQIPDPGFQIPDPGFQIPDSRNAGYQIPESAIRTQGGAPPRPRPGYQISGSGRPGQRPPPADAQKPDPAVAKAALGARRAGAVPHVPESGHRSRPGGGRGRGRRAGSEVRGGRRGEGGRGAGGGGRTPGSLVLMKETQETGPEIPPGKLVFPSLAIAATDKTFFPFR